MKISGLYIITDHNHDNRLTERVDAALRGGARIIQYRDKESSADEQIAMAGKLAELCRKYNALFLINDSPELALAIDADGIHLGQQDMSINAARQLLGPNKIIGISTRTVEQAYKAEAAGADYIAVGSMFKTGSKADAETVGTDRLRAIKEKISKPIVAIGGIDQTNAAEVVDAGADALAVISAVMQDKNPAIAAREINLAFNRNKPFPSGRVLTIAGSDSSGGAGIQADLKTITLLGGYGMSAITALTAQNSCGVTSIHPCPVDFVDAQIESVLSDIGADTIKTGMLFSAEIVTLVAARLGTTLIPAVVDPVMIAKGGASLLKTDAVQAVREKLIPVTYLLMPNLPETEALVGFSVSSMENMKKAASALHEMGARYVLIKGGHLDKVADDLLLADGDFTILPAERIETKHTHGTGCTYSAAISTLLAQGNSVEVSVTRAKKFIHEAIRTAPGIGKGHGPVNHFQAAIKLMHEGRNCRPEK